LKQAALTDFQQLTPFFQVTGPEFSRSSA